MILPIIIDTTSMLDQFTGLTGENINNMLDNMAKGLAANFAQKLEEMASRELHQTRSAYIKNIKLIDSGKLEGTVMLDYSKDPIVRMIEEGQDAFDMKPDMLKSAKVKIGKNGGRYLTIPFRWSTPGAVGDSDVFGGQMPMEVYDIVRIKIPTISVSGGGTRSAGLALKDIPLAFQDKKVRAPIVDNKGNEKFAAYQHKNSNYEGIVKQNDPATGQNSYHSFRRISEKSDPDSWIHPGIQKYNLIQKTLSEFSVETELGLQLDNELNKLGLL